MPSGVQKDIKTANCYSAYANAHERMGALELANYYKRETVEIYCEIYKKDASYLYDYAKSIYELATFVWITDKEQALLLLNDIEELLNKEKEPTIFSQLLLVSVKNLRAWTMLENKEYERAVELFKECANQVESIEGFEKIELAVSTLFVSYKGLFNSYRRLKKRKMAFKTYFKCYKYSLKKQFTGQFIDIYLSIINNGLI
jgi:tetratricopeptide (TPR) repeat protein